MVATDGSHLDVDRHVPVRSYLVNIGRVVLRYGSEPGANLDSIPTLRSREEELALRDPSSALREVPVEGPLLGMKRTVMELEALAELAEALPQELPVLALVDGSLVLFGLAGRTYPDFVRAEILAGGLLPALERLRMQAEQRPLVVASYISLPGSREVVNALRLQACPYESVDCDGYCGSLRPGLRPCDTVHGLTDRQLFEAVLDPGWRSGLFRSTSSVVVERYGIHRISFWYLHVGQEVVRVEVPEWTTAAGIEFAHAAILSQSQKGLGYPVALSEAHEQAVVTLQDRRYFEELLEAALQEERLPVFTSEKARSKRLRFL